MIALKNVIKGHMTFEKINLNHAYYFFKVIKNIDPNLLNLNKTYSKNTDAVIYEIKSLMMQSINSQNIDRAIPLCLGFSNVYAYIIEQYNIELYKKLWSEIKKKLRQ